MLALISAATPFSAPTDGATVSSIENGFAGLMMLLAMYLVIAGIACVLQALHAAWHGERLMRPRWQPISSVRSGHVVLTGVVEPAWSLLSSPLGFTRPETTSYPGAKIAERSERVSRPLVYYEAETDQGRGRSSHIVFHEKNAVPFILNDQTGRVLVLGRRARWDAGTSMLDLQGGEKALDEGDTADQVTGLLEGRRLLPPPGPLSQKGDRHEGGMSREVRLTVGECVTVIGRAAPDDRAVKPIDACMDDGSSFGLGSLFRVGPEPIWGLDVVAGTPRDVSFRGRLRLAVGLLGIAMLLAAIVSLAAGISTTGHYFPAAGTIMFGTSYDDWSGIHGEDTTFSEGQEIVAVAKFASQVSNGDVITVLVDGSQVAIWTAEDGKSGPGGCKIDFGPGGLTSGRHVVDLLGWTHIELATGTVTVGP